MTDIRPAQRRIPRWWVWLLILAVLAVTLYMTYYPLLSLRPMEQWLRWEPLW